jgi:hypothetical protein
LNNLDDYSFRSTVGVRGDKPYVVSHHKITFDMDGWIDESGHG